MGAGVELGVPERFEPAGAATGLPTKRDDHCDAARRLLIDDPAAPADAAAPATAAAAAVDIFLVLPVYDKAAAVPGTSRRDLLRFGARRTLLA